MDRVFAHARTRYVIPMIVVGAMIPFIIIAPILPRWRQAGESSVEFVVLMVASYVSIFVVLWVIWCSQMRLSDLFGPMPDARDSKTLLALGIPMVGVAVLSVYLVFFPLLFIAPEFVNWWISNVARGELLVSLETPNAIIINLGNTILSVLAAPIVEELIFRGFLFGRWYAKYGILVAISLSSLLFAILHADILGAVIFSIFLCLIRIKYNSLLAPILVHIGNNAVLVGLTAVEIFFFGVEYEYTVQEFRSSWWVAPIGAFIGIPWLYRYYQAEIAIESRTQNVA